MDCRVIACIITDSSALTASIGSSKYITPLTNVPVRVGEDNSDILLSPDYGDGLCCKLVHACPKVRPTVAFRELEINRHGIKLLSKLGAGHFGEVWSGMFYHT